QGTIVRCNPAAERALGCARAELEGRRFWDLFPMSREVGEARTQFQRLLAGEIETSAHEGEWVAPDGHRRRIAWLQSAVPEGKWDVRFVVVTESRRAADALRQSEERLRAAFADAPIGMALCDLDGHIREVNAAYSHITGHAAADLRGRHFLSITHPE